MTNHPNYPPSVERLQRYLRQLSYDEPTLQAPPIDGIFETQTEDALREFQRLRGIPITGSADQETWERLYDDYRASLAYNSPSRPILAFPLDPFGYVITSGSVGFPVLAVQYMLSELSYNYFGLSGIELSGVYDEQTQNAVRTFQSGNRLPVDGTVGLVTWNAIADQYNALFSKTNIE